MASPYSSLCFRLIAIAPLKRQRLSTPALTIGKQLTVAANDTTITAIRRFSDASAHRDSPSSPSVPPAPPSHQSRASSQSLPQTSYQSPFADFFATINSGKTSSGLSDTDFTEYNQPLKYLECGVPEDVLSFKTASYPMTMMTPYVQDGEYKITMKVNGKYLPFATDKEWEIFRQIVGRRYSEKHRCLKLVSDQFASRIENKRHCVSMLNRIVFSVKRLAKQIQEEETEANNT